MDVVQNVLSDGQKMLSQKFLRTAKEPALVRLVSQRQLLNSNPLGKLSLPGDKVTAFGHLIKLTDKEQGNFESVSWIMLIWLDIR